MSQPRALSNITGNRELILPEQGINLKILLSKETAHKPIVTRMSRELQTDFMILGGETERYRNSILGSIIINISEDLLPQIGKYLDEHNVVWEQINEQKVNDNVQ
jgi:D-methionine transport system ATP-binding protein